MSPFPHSPHAAPGGSRSVSPSLLPRPAGNSGSLPVSQWRPDPQHGSRSARLVVAAQQAAAADAASAAAAAADGGQGATDHLGRLLRNLPVIEQAKGLLMGYYALDADSAYQLLRRWSQHTNLKLSHIAELLVSAASQPSPPPGPPFAALQTFLTTLRSTLPAENLDTSRNT